MQRIKLFLGTILLVLILLVLTTSSVHPEKDKIGSTEIPPKVSLVDKKEIQLYNFRKKALADAITSYFEKAIVSRRYYWSRS